MKTAGLPSSWTAG